MLSAWMLLRWIPMFSGFPTGWGWPMQKLLKKPKTADEEHTKEQMVKSPSLVNPARQKGVHCPKPKVRSVLFLLSIVTIITIRAQEKKRRNQTIVNKQVYERGSGNGYTTGITKTS